MRVGVLRADDFGCGWYRCSLPAAVANAVDAAEVSLLDRLYIRVDEHGHVREVPAVAADVIVLQRPLNRRLADAIPLIQAQGVGVCIELDDDIENVPAGHIQFRELHADDSLHWFREAVRRADAMTVSTPALARRYRRHVPVAVVRNYIPGAWTIVEKQPLPRPSIGWSGQVPYHVGDLDVVGGAVRQVMREFDMGFYHIGDPVGVTRALGVAEDAVTSTGYRPITSYPAELARIDIGIVPLARNQFNHAKSWLKGLEFAALGVPFVASPTEEYEALHRQFGIGLLARTPADWLKQLRRLASSADLRAEVGARGRDIVAERLIIERHADDWTAAWRAAQSAATNAALSGRTDADGVACPA